MRAMACVLGVCVLGTSWAATITTAVGGGGSGKFGSGQSFGTRPNVVATDDKGNVYYANMNRVHRMDRNAVVAVVAGYGGTDFSGDGGPALQAGLGEVGGLAVDAAGNLYISDVSHSRVRRVGVDGRISTVAGNGEEGYSGDGGAATNAQLSYPRGLAIDAGGTLYIADRGNDRIRRVSPDGSIDTFAGGGSQSGATGGIAAIDLHLNSPMDVAVDNLGAVLIADTSAERILRVTPAGIATPIAGEGVPTDDPADIAGSSRRPAGIAVAPDGTVYYSESYGHRIRAISPEGSISVIAGRYSSAHFTGDGGEALAATLNIPMGVAVDLRGNVFVADSENYRIRRIATGSEDPDRIGAGAFLPYRGMPEASKPGDVAVGDVTGDGRADVVVAASWHYGEPDPENDYHVFIHVQRPDGSLAAPVKVDYRGMRSDHNYASVELAEMNGDGMLDIVVADMGGVSVIAGSRTGQYSVTRTTKVSPGAGGLDLVVMDVDLDGRQDAVAFTGNIYQTGESGVMVYRGTGQGSVLPPVRLDNGGYSLSSTVDLAKGDLNGDGLEDLAAVQFGGSVILLMQVPSGGFAPGYSFEFNVGAVAIGDLDGDGRDDMVLSRASAPRYDMRIYGQTATGTLAYREQINATEVAVSLRIADIDGDRKNDLLVSRNGHQAIAYYQNTPLGLAEQVEYVVPSALEVDIGDINGDGCRDVAMASVYDLVLLHGTGCSKALPDNDFDGDGVSDLLWRDGARGNNVVWRGADYGLQLPVTAVTNVAWKVAGTADFNGDGQADILWRNASSGANVIWRSADHRRQLPVQTVASQDWQVAATADFDGDGRADILWRHAVTGVNVIWRSGDYAMQSSVRAVSNLSWRVAGAGDFDGDGRADVLWHNADTGANVIWNGADYGDQRAVTGIRNLDWKPAGIGDFDGDGRSDIAWRNRATGQNAVWRSGNYATQQAMRTVSDVRWEIRGTGDYDGDGRADVLWRHASSGANVIWRGADYARQQRVVTVTGASWRIED